jgi:ABC-type nitrate/sulfonate/bicarbonate transport system permease component
VSRRFGPPLALVALLLGAWELYARSSGVSPFVLPAPTQVVGALWDFRDQAVRHAVPT